MLKKNKKNCLYSNHLVNIPCPDNAGMFLNINGGKVHIPYLFVKTKIKTNLDI